MTVKLELGTDGDLKGTDGFNGISMNMGTVPVDDRGARGLESGRIDGDMYEKARQSLQSEHGAVSGHTWTRRRLLQQSRHTEHTRWGKNNSTILRLFFVFLDVVF